ARLYSSLEARTLDATCLRRRASSDASAALRVAEALSLAPVASHRALRAARLLKETSSRDPAALLEQDMEQNMRAGFTHRTLVVNSRLERLPQRSQSRTTVRFHLPPGL